MAVNSAFSNQLPSIFKLLKFYNQNISKDE